MLKKNINGITVFHEKDSSDIMSIRFIVNAGSSLENSEEYGVAHFLEHMIFKSTKKRSCEELNRIISDIGYSNAYTGNNSTVFYLNSFVDDFEIALDVLCEMFFEPKLSKEEFEKEKTVILEEYQTMQDDPFSFYFYSTYELLWGKWGHDILGTPETLSKMSIETIKNFYEKHYTSENICISVVGNIDEEQVLRKLNKNKALSGISITYANANEGEVEVEVYPKFKTGNHTIYHSSQQSIIGFHYNAFSAEESRKHFFVNEVLCSGLGGGSHSLLNNRLREELGLCYSAGAYNFKYLNNGNISLYCLLEEKNIELACSEILDILNKVKINGFEESFLNTSKKKLIFDLASSIETSSGYSSVVYDDYFIENKYVFDFEEYGNKIKNITNDDIIRYANLLFHYDNCCFVKMIHG